jgi:methionine synthase I (cobalamin-dependent)
MSLLESVLDSESYLLLDGAMGTMLMAAGLDSGEAPEEWNVLYPERVRAVHRAYIQAGSRLILTNSFGGTRYRLSLHNLQEQVGELNRAAAANARAEADAAPHTVIVGGSMGPTGELFAPMGTMVFEEAKAAFAEQARALAEGGVDVIWIETMSDLNEVKAAVEGARSVCDLPISATLTFDTHGHTMMGVSPERATEAFKDLDLIVMGANCGTGPEEVEMVIETMHKINPQAILVAKANAGLPKWVNQELHYDGTPQVMANYAVRVRDLGARLIGACCGSTPEHIRAMSEALKQ